MRVTLTFDNGPDPSVTPQVLDILRERGLVAYFFVLGHKIATPEGRALAERALAEGHLLGNHSYTHETPLGLDPRPDVVEREIIATETLLAPISAAATRLFRPFGGGGKLGPHLLSQAAARYLESHGYACALWNSVPRDWEDPDGWPARAHEDCARLEHVVLVLHDFPNASLTRLAQWLDEAKARGVTFTTELPASCVPTDLSSITAAA